MSKFIYSNMNEHLGIYPDFSLLRIWLLELVSYEFPGVSAPFHLA